MAEMKKVLIAEDEVLSRRLAVTAVRQCGFVPIEASNGRIAWEILCDNPDIGLVITDMIMPEMGGQELIERIRAKGGSEEPAIIIMSAQITLKEIEHTLLIGATRFLPKPIDMSMLREYILDLYSDLPQEQIHGLA